MIRNPRFWLTLAAGALVLGLGVLISLTASTTPTNEVSESTAPTSVPTTPAPFTTTTLPDTTTTITQPSTTTTPTTTTTLPCEAHPDILIARATGISHLVECMETVVWQGGPTRVAVPDPEGGIVFQGTIAGTESPMDSIFRIDPDGGSLQPVYEHGEHRIRLWDTSLVAGSSVAIFTQYESSSSEPWNNDRQYLMTVPVAGGDPTVLSEVGGWEWGPFTLTAGGDRFATERGFFEDEVFDLLDSDGAPIRQSMELSRWCIWMIHGDDPCRSELAMAPDGSTVAYVEAKGADLACRLILVDVQSESRSEVRVDLGHECEDVIDGLHDVDFDGRYLLIASSQHLLVIDANNGTVTQLPTPTGDYTATLAG